MTDQEFCERVLECVANPAEIEDVVVLCETTALYRKRKGAAADLVIDQRILETAIHRVVVG
jgi:predicted nucleic-acid-binding protein